LPSGESTLSDQVKPEDLVISKIWIWQISQLNFVVNSYIYILEIFTDIRAASNC
jgi:hypothetical protein